MQEGCKEGGVGGGGHQPPMCPILPMDTNFKIQNSNTKQMQQTYLMSF